MADDSSKELSFDFDKIEEEQEEDGLPEITLTKQLTDFVIKAISSVEVTLFLYFFATTLFQSAQERLIKDRICEVHYSSDALCHQVLTAPLQYPSETSAISYDFLLFTTVAGLCTNLPLVIVVVTHGSWCDRIGHKASIILPHIGDTLVAICFLIYSYIPRHPINPIYFGFTSLFSGLSGSWACIVMACTSYAMISTSFPKRVLRIALIEGASTLGQLMAYLLKEILVGSASYQLAFLVQICAHLYAIVHCVCLIPEVHSKEFVEENRNRHANGSKIRNLFIVKQNFPVVFSIFRGKAPPGRPVRTPRYQQVMLIACMMSAAVIGPKALTKITDTFLTLPPISMSQSTYFKFMALLSGSMAFALIILIRLFTISPHLGYNIFPLSDAALAVLGLIMRIVSLLVLATANLWPDVSPWLYCVLSMFSIFPIMAIRSGMSKLADDEKQGRLFAVLTQLENLAQTIGMYGYSQLFQLLVVKNGLGYTQLVGVLRGYTLFFVAGLTLLPLILVVWLGKRKIPNWSFWKYDPWVSKGRPPTYSFGSVLSLTE